MPLIRGSALDFEQLPGRLSADPLPRGLADCAVRVVRIPPGPRTPHRHPRSPEVAYVASGSGTAWEAGSAQRVSAGDLLVIPAGVPHATAAGEDGLVLVCFFPDGDLETNIEELDTPVVTVST